MLNKALRELEDYKYEYQYFQEKSKEIDRLKKEIQKSYDRLNELKANKIDTTELNIQLQKIIDKQTSEENALLNILERKQSIEKKLDNLPQPYKNIFFLKYISMNTFDQIALKMNYSTKRIYQLHKKGVILYCSMCESESVPRISKS